MADIGNTVGTAGSITVNTSLSNSIEITDDTDWYRVALIAGTTYQFDVRGHDSAGGTLVDPFMRLRDVNGTSLIADDDDGTGLDSQISFYCAKTDTYYVSVGSANSGTGTYTLTATALAQNWNRIVDIPDNINAGRTDPTNSSMIALLGTPVHLEAGVFGPDTWASTQVQNLLVRNVDVDPTSHAINIASGIAPAVTSLSQIFARVASEHPDLMPHLSSAGMTVVRYIAEDSSRPISNHSWGIAVDLYLDNALDTTVNGRTWAGILALVPYFHDAGWVSGAGWGASEDSMHFEVSLETLQQWSTQGLLSPTQTAKPDIVIGSLSLGSTSVTAGGSLTINFSVANVNSTGATAAATTTKIYLSQDAFIDAGDTLLNTYTTPQLLANQSSSGSMTTTLPANLAPGTYNIVIAADTANVVTNEVSETNNVFAQSFTITGVPTQPDLRAATYLNGTTFVAGSSTSIDFWNVNFGQGAAAASTSRIYLSTDSTIDTGDLVLATVNSPGLSANNSAGYYDNQNIAVSFAALAPGTYWVGAIADYGNGVAESNNGNNTYNVTQITLTAPAQPDLRAATYLSGTTFAAGSGTTVDFWNVNFGQAAAAASSSRIYLSSDSTIDTGDLVLATVNSPGLAANSAAGYYDHRSVSVSFASSLPPGTYWVGAIADFGNGVPENNDGNNTYNVTQITITGPTQPDLRAATYLSGTTFAAGSGLTVDFWNVNFGQGAAAASSSRIYLSADANIDTGDLVLATVNSPALSANSVSGYYDHQSISVNFASSLPPGTYWIGAIADYGNGIAESNNANNTYNFTQITVTGPAQPDLSAATYLNGTVFAAGNGTTIDFWDVNFGQGAAAASSSRIYLSADANIDTGDLVLATVNSPGLSANGAAGYYDHQSITVNFASSLAPGTYWVGALADYGNGIAEINEANNAHNVTQITITGPAQPDLRAAAYLSGTMFAAGGSTTVDFWDVNFGKGAASASTSRIYLSVDANIDPGDLVLATVNSPGLSANGGAGYYDHQSVAVTLASYLPAGTYYIGALADYGNGVVESNEANNTVNVTQITVTAPAQPDLRAATYMNGTSFAAGGSTSVDFWNVNFGQGSAAASTSRIFLSADANIDTGDLVLANVNSPGLAANGATGYYDHQSVSVTFASSLAPGTYWIGAIADYGNGVTETNDTNNAYNVTQIQITAPSTTVTLNDAAMWNAGALSVVNTFNGNGGTVTYYAPISYSGFMLTNLNRSDFSFVSNDSGFASANNYFFDGARVLEVPAGGSAAIDTIRIQQQNGAAFSVQSVDLDTLFAAVSQSTTFTGTKTDHSHVTQTFNLDNTAGMQNFQFSSAFTDLTQLDFSPTMNIYFDNFMLHV